MSIAVFSDFQLAVNEDLGNSSTNLDENSLIKAGSLSGRWTDDEHKLFLEGVKLYHKNWKKLAVFIKTRTPVQVRAHAQKYFRKLGKVLNENPNKEVCFKRSVDDSVRLFMFSLIYKIST
mmetsp:Transcript_37732/g.38401  ORF Transcript_37732/g.38401 Transcript_37732/m.38401 type:complete len:120 (-) Transcript_37732:747-1106(-)